MIPVAIWFAGDLGIWALMGDSTFAFHQNMGAVYVGILLVAMIGMVLRKQRSLPAVLLTGLVAETVYFVITNLGAWQFSPAYTKDLAGLEHCFYLAIPFFGRSLTSTLFFSVVLFSPFILRERKARQLAMKSPTAAA